MAATSPSQSSTVTVSAEWGLKPSTRGMRWRKCTHTPRSGFVPKVRPSSAKDTLAPTDVYQR